ncbi:hypothetical protein SAMN04490244_106222 [Tranquillimonas rosea]|uniref:DUF1284 domain-containing protein n=1 Tax=Tranquillimonas rosea TaxID=641238 RepID=A0A1H9V3W4_9RHOB|nr:DUF1284 domain-containing protein [Tranquillimonas rosea]SES16241.1 hypothetical protein SAMN04490244_106222 [Tranquillimonas rosea]
MTLRYRPHHFLCSLGFRGAGYSDGFTANMARIVGGLRAPGGEGTVIEVTGSADGICGPCPKRRGAGCVSQDKIDRLDAAHGKALGVAPGDRLSWGEARRRIRDNVRPGDLATLCAGCQWLSLGYCEDALAELHAG